MEKTSDEIRIAAMDYGENYGDFNLPILLAYVAGYDQCKKDTEPLDAISRILQKWDYDDREYQGRIALAQKHGGPRHAESVKDILLERKKFANVCKGFLENYKNPENLR